MPMTKHHFFGVFDDAWKKLTEKKHAIAGFKATGLVPFNPNQIDYTKILDSASNKKKIQNSNRYIDKHNRVGIHMAFQKIQTILPSDKIALFEKRFSEGYDLNENSDGCFLWKIYKEVKSLLIENTVNEDADNNSTPTPPTSEIDLPTCTISLGTSSPGNSNFLTTVSQSNSPTNTRVIPAILQEEFNEITDFDLPDIQMNSPSPAASLSTAFSPSITLFVSSDNAVEETAINSSFLTEEISLQPSTSPLAQVIPPKASTSSSIQVISFQPPTSSSTQVISPKASTSSSIQVISFQPPTSSSTQVISPKASTSSSTQIISFQPPTSSSTQIIPPKASTQEISPKPSTSSSQKDTGSPAARRKLSFDAWEFSPFKHYLKIADSTIITRKITKVKPKTPPAISGSCYVAMLQLEQDRKEKLLQEKEARKKDREEKRRKREEEKEKKKGKKTKKTSDDCLESDHESSNEEIVFAGSSDDDLQLDTDNCGACGGDDGWDDGEKWIGCNLCVRWFHKDCISIDVASMDEDELQALQFKCHDCERREMRRAKKMKK